MAETEPRIVLIDGVGNAVELKLSTEPGADSLLEGIRALLAAGTESGLLVKNPFIIPQAEAALTTGQEQAAECPRAPVTISRGHTLALAAACYKHRLQDPQRLYDFYQAHWDYYGIELMGLSQSDTRVGPPPYDEDGIRQFMKLENPQPGNPGVDLGYFHLPVLASSDARALIGRGFSNLGNSRAFQSGYGIINGHQTSGWMRVDASLSAPYRSNKNGELTGLNVDELREAIKADNRSGQTVNIYGPSGNVIKQMFGYYPDQDFTWSRLSGSLRGGKALYVYFSSGGYFDVGSSWSGQSRYPKVGGRSFLGA